MASTQRSMSRHGRTAAAASAPSASLNWVTLNTDASCWPAAGCTAAGLLSRYRIMEEKFRLGIILRLFFDGLVPVTTPTWTAQGCPVVRSGSETPDRQDVVARWSLIRGAVGASLRRAERSYDLSHTFILWKLTS